MKSNKNSSLKQSSNDSSNATAECEIGWTEAIRSSANSSGSYLDDMCIKLLDSAYPSPIYTSPVNSEHGSNFIVKHIGHFLLIFSFSATPLARKFSTPWNPAMLSA